MKKLGPVLLVGVVAVVGYLYFRSGGTLSGGGASGGSLPLDKGKDAVSGAADKIYRQPWFWTAVVAGALAAIGFMTWKRIGGWGRAFVLVAAAVAITVIVTRVG